MDVTSLFGDHPRTALRELQLDSECLRSVAWSPDGARLAAGGLVVEHWLSYGLFWANFSRASDVALAVLRRCKAVFPETPGGEAAAWLAGAKRAPRFVDVSRRNVNRRDAAADRALSPSQLDAVLALPAVRREGAIWHALRRDHGLDACSGFGCWRADGTVDRGRRPPS